MTRGVVPLATLSAALSVVLLAGCSTENGAAADASTQAGDAAQAVQDGATSTTDGGGGEEKTLAACKDGLDNDHDDYTDCADQDCWIYAICLTADAGGGAADTGAANPGSDAGGVAPDGGAAVPVLNARSLALVCTSSSIAGFDTFGETIECKILGGDYFGAYVPGAVSLMSEAGGVPPSVTFAEDGSSGGGEARFIYKAQCPYPRDVPPLGAAVNDEGTSCQFMNACKVPSETETRICNPRDALAMLVAATTGGESFEDNNANGTWDPTETFVDLPEPFLDANDNGTCDADEDFYDANHNGHWDEANGAWDADSAIWVSETITWTGGPH